MSDNSSIPKKFTTYRGGTVSPGLTMAVIDSLGGVEAFIKNHEVVLKSSRKKHYRAVHEAYAIDFFNTHSTRVIKALALIAEHKGVESGITLIKSDETLMKKFNINSDSVAEALYAKYKPIEKSTDERVAVIAFAVQQCFAEVCRNYSVFLATDKPS